MKRREFLLGASVCLLTSSAFAGAGGNVGQKSANGNWNGGPTTNGPSSGRVTPRERTSAEKNDRSNPHSGGVGDKTGHTAQMNDKAQP